MKAKEIFELRRSEIYFNKPEIKNDVMVELQKYLNDENIYISFTMNMTSATQSSRISSTEYSNRIDKETYRTAINPKSKDTVGYKIGLNPKTYDGGTPIGIYCFPLKKAWQFYKIKQKGLEGFPDITQNRSHIYVLKPKIKLIDVITLTDYSNAIIKLAKSKFKFNDKKIQFGMNYTDTQVDLSNFTQDEIDSYELWSLTKYMSNFKNDPKTDDYDPVIWNKIFKQIGINALIDNGSGIIHKAEPVQAVFFSKSDFDVVTVLDIKIKDEGNRIMPTLINIKKDISVGNFESILSVNPEYWERLIPIENSQKILGDFLSYLLYNKKYNYISDFFLLFGGTLSNLHQKLNYPSQYIQNYLLDTKNYEIVNYLPKYILVSTLLSMQSHEMIKNILNYLKPKKMLYNSIMNAIPIWMREL